MNWTRYLCDPALAGYVPVERHGARALVLAELREQVEMLGLAAGPVEAEEVVAGGRVAHPVVRLPDGVRAVVRGYRRGGMVRHLNRERYLAGHRAFEELRVTARARRAGVRAPEVLAAVERPRGIGYTARLATRWIEGAHGLPEWLGAADPGRRAEVLGEAGRQVARMHAAGIAHPDLNLGNLLVRESSGGEVILLDFDRARLTDGAVAPGRRARDLLRLARSARKLRAPIDGAGWAALREGYGSGWPLRSPLG